MLVCNCRSGDVGGGGDITDYIGQKQTEDVSEAREINLQKY